MGHTHKKNKAPATVHILNIARLDFGFLGENI